MHKLIFYSLFAGQLIGGSTFQLLCLSSHNIQAFPFLSKFFFHALALGFFLGGVAFSLSGLCFQLCNFCCQAISPCHRIRLREYHSIHLTPPSLLVVVALFAGLLMLQTFLHQLGKLITKILNRSASTPPSSFRGVTCLCFSSLRRVACLLRLSKLLTKPALIGTKCRVLCLSFCHLSGKFLL